jgi:hypothetical protein
MRMICANRIFALPLLTALKDDLSSYAYETITT